MLTLNLMLNEKSKFWQPITIDNIKFTDGKIQNT